MVFSNKKQSRIWLVSLVYKLLIRDQEFPPINFELSSVQQLSSFFEDDIIFSYERGDLDYFKQIYNSVAHNIAEIHSKISDSMKLKSLNPFVKACMISAIAEIDYAEVDKKTISSRYKEIIRNHSSDGSEKVMDLLTRE